jgi:hypothetical protein
MTKNKVSKEMQKFEDFGIHHSENDIKEKIKVPKCLHSLALSMPTDDFHILLKMLKRNYPYLFQNKKTKITGTSERIEKNPSNKSTSKEKKSSSDKTKKS